MRPPRLIGSGSPPAAAGRLAVILGTAAAHGLRLAWRCRSAQARAEGGGGAALAGAALADLFERLGPTFIKVGQVLSARPDLLPAGVAGPLARLQDRVAPLYPGGAERVVRESLGRAAGAFRRFDPVPVAAASVAQVHRAELQDGRVVAVKVRRPDAVRLIDRDLRLLGAAARLAGRLPALRSAPLEEMVADIGSAIREQLDFVREAENNRRFRVHFAGVDLVQFPRLVDELCGDAVVTMEFLDGLERVDADGLPADRRRDVALAGLRALYRMIFVHGFVHADMHPGNVFLGRWGEFIILDTGLVARLAPDDRSDFAEFFFGIVENDGPRCARIVLENASYVAPWCDRAGFEAGITGLVARYSALRSRDFEIAGFVAGLIGLQRQYGVRGATAFMTTVLAMVVFEGICKRLHPECDFQAEARGYLVEARYHGACGPVRSPAEGSLMAWQPVQDRGMTDARIRSNMGIKT